MRPKAYNVARARRVDGRARVINQFIPEDLTTHA